MPSITLHLAPGACSLSAHILLQETGLAFSTVFIDVIKGAPASLQQINPKMRVPVLILDDQTITETTAIFTAIAQLAPSKSLLGSTPFETVRAYEWCNWLSGTMHGQAWGQILRAARLSDEASAWDGIRLKGAQNAKNAYAFIEQTLEGVHAVGNTFTVADAFIFVFWRWGVFHGLVDKMTYPKQFALVEELVKRPSTKKALEDEGIDSLLDKV